MIRVTSPNMYVGRRRPVRVVVLHTAQAPCLPGRAEGVMRYLANDYVDASAHYCTDPDNTVAGVDEADTAWATPSVNADGIQIEQTGYAEFGSGEAIPTDNTAARQAYGGYWPSWDSAMPQRMLRTQVVPLVADICRRHGLPAVLLEPADLLAGRSGITDHHRCSVAYGGDHWDCGGAYPLVGVIDDVRRALGGAQPTSTEPFPPSTIEAPMHVGQDIRGNLWLFTSPTDYRLIPAGDWEKDVNPKLIRWARAGLIRTNDDGSPFIGKVLDDVWNDSILNLRRID